MRFRAIVTLLCGCLAVLAVATSLSALELKGPVSLAQATTAAAATDKCAYNPKTNRCGGICPKGQNCVKKSDKECGCETPYTCAYNPKTKTCGGTCPKGQTCQKITSTNCTCK